MYHMKICIIQLYQLLKVIFLFSEQEIGKS